MPDVNQYNFKYKEVVEALIKSAGVHEGKWQLLVQFGIAAANMGPTPSEVVPGAAVLITSVGLTRATSESPESLVADAAIVNPSGREA
jgi:hypothetical protein